MISKELLCLDDPAEQREILEQHRMLLDDSLVAALKEEAT
jgi:hypothetical protein